MIEGKHEEPFWKQRHLNQIKSSGNARAEARQKAIALPLTTARKALEEPPDFLRLPLSELTAKTPDV